MRTVSATYMLPVEGHGGCWLDSRPLAVEAECEHVGDDVVLLIWTPACLATLASAELDAEALVGCQEAIEEAFWSSASEHERRVGSVPVRVEHGSPATAAQVVFVALSVLEEFRLRPLGGDTRRVRIA